MILVKYGLYGDKQYFLPINKGNLIAHYTFFYNILKLP